MAYSTVSQMTKGPAKEPSLRELYDQTKKRFWAESDAWERSAANESHLLSEESDENWELIQRAAQMDYSEAAAFEPHLEAANTGSLMCQQMVGWHYWTGNGVAADKYLASQYYHSAICGGSWMATLHYARLLYDIGRYDDCESVLNDGVDCGFVPSFYWLAWFRHKRHGTRAVREEVRPLVEHAAKAGHPGARDLLIHWMATGRLRLRDIPRGFLMVLQGAIAPANREDNR